MVDKEEPTLEDFGKAMVGVGCLLCLVPVVLIVLFVLVGMM